MCDGHAGHLTDPEKEKDRREGSPRSDQHIFTVPISIPSHLPISLALYPLYGSARRPPQKKNRARCGIKYPLKIFKGDLETDSEYIDEDFEDTASQIIADVDVNEGNEHHLQAALATKAVFIPTPGAIRIVDNYDELYPKDRWTDPVSYLKTTQTVEEACSHGLVEHEYTYYMDETDKLWLDKNNQQARGEGTSAQGARSVYKGKAKSPEMGVPVSISEDEFELVMGLLEKITDQKIPKSDGLAFSSFEPFFLKPLPADFFASYVTPSWIPPPALLVRIARTMHPHWEQRRSPLNGRQIRPTLNFDESDFPNESYICFRRRDNKPVRKTRAGQATNHADKLAQLDRNLSQALDIANALLARENVKQAAAVQSHNLWQARRPMADLLRKFPSLVTKADEERLLDKPRKPKTSRSALPKVKVLPPSHPGTPPATAMGQSMLPSQRCAAIQQEIMKNMQRESQEIKEHGQVDVVDDPFQSCLVPRAEKMWVDVPPPSSSASQREPVNCHSVRMRCGRGGRRFLDRRRSSHPYAPELRNHRRHADDDLDEESVRRLHGQWRFDADCSSGPAEEENRELVDEYDTRFLAQRIAWMTKAEATLVTDASLAIHGRDTRILPAEFNTNAEFVVGILEKPSLSGYLAELGIRAARPSLFGSPAPNRVAARATPGPQKPTPISSPSSLQPSPQRVQAAMRPPPRPPHDPRSRAPPLPRPPRVLSLLPRPPRALWLPPLPPRRGWKKTSPRSQVQFPPRPPCTRPRGHGPMSPSRSHTTQIPSSPERTATPSRLAAATARKGVRSTSTSMAIASLTVAPPTHTDSRRTRKRTRCRRTARARRRHQDMSRWVRGQ
ncbi:enhancer of polycomb-like-domain-containing protein [Mycena galopus ATCC 62051]|nr:enhancer of polycomb-like-domain-containing protein [Mycena galopus ATCC 62051]